MIEADVETTGLQFPYHEAFCAQFYDGVNEAEIMYADERGFTEWVQQWLDRASYDGFRAWNSKFDLAFFKKMGVKLPPEDKWYDGMLDAQILDENRSNALKALGDSLGFGKGKDLQADVKAFLQMETKHRKKLSKESGDEMVFPNYSDVPRDIMTPYALEDVLLTKQVCDVLEPQLAQTPELLPVLAFEREVMAALFAVEQRGFPVDEAGYHQLELEVAQNLDRMHDVLEALAAVGVEEGDEFEFNPKSSPQVYKALERRGADMRFVTGQSMDAENLETVNDELAIKILDFRSEFKVLSTYVRPYIHRSWESRINGYKEPFVAPNGRIHAGYRQVGARTGRMSSNDPNVQNQPRDDLRLRYNFRAEPGMKLVTCDLNSIEMAVLAAYAGNGRMKTAIMEGTDMHTMTADFIGLHERKRPGGVIESKRQRGKTYNFATMYGLGIRGTRKKFQVSMDEARNMRNRYMEMYPEIETLQNRVEWRLEDRGYITSLLGRRFHMNSRDAYKAVNYLVQGTAAEVLKLALVKCHKDGIPVVGLVHDEVIAYVSEAEAEEVKRTIIKHLIDCPEIVERVPLAADGDIVDRWSEAKDPNFKPAWEKES